MCPEYEYDAVVIGAGVAGLTAAADLTRRKLRTLVIERHNVPGGCASFYQRAGYRFEVGATLVGGFGQRGVHRLLNARLGIDVSCEAIDPSMVVHLPDRTVLRYGDERWRAERVRAFGCAAEPFWRNQERIAELAWDLSSRLPALPVDVPSALALTRALRLRHVALLGTLGRNLASIMPRRPTEALSAFVDAQLLITSQADASGTDLTYGATALDLAREGTFHLAGGVSAISVALARTIGRAGSRIRYNTCATALDVRRGKIRGVMLDDGTRIACDRVIAAIPVGDACALSPELASALHRRVAALPQRWGAFMLYGGFPPGVVPTDFPTHHQIVMAYGAPLGEGTTAFLSFSGHGDIRRARNGGRALTMSTHTDVSRWERAHRDGTTAALRERYAERLRAALDRILPGAAARADLIEAADPHTFARYTGRGRGLVGGLPQSPGSAILGALSHQTPVRGLYLAGDTTFPGQSTVGATLGGLSAARAAAHRA
jgi:C-3',4' desaturase CrtD